MKQQTQVKRMKLRGKTESPSLQSESRAEWIDCSEKKDGKGWRFQADRLTRNLAVAGGLMLVMVAVKNAGVPESQSVFSALQASMNTEWDESVGKLSFVSSFLPESIQAVWKEREAVTVYAPVAGETVHAWSQREPYLEVQSAVTDVRAAAAGEVMSIAHGLEEERIVRIRHEDETETLYGNLRDCFVEIGDRVEAGEIFASLLSGKPLAFELRREGRSVNPAGLLLPYPE